MSAFGLHRLPNTELERLLRALHRGALPSPITRSSLIEKAFGHIEGHLDLVVGRDVAAAKALVIAVLAERANTPGAVARLAYCGPAGPGSRSRDLLEQVRELLATAKRGAAVYGLRLGGSAELYGTLRALVAGRDATLRLVFDAHGTDHPIEQVRAWVAQLLPAHPSIEVFAVNAVSLRARAVVVDDERVLITSGELDAREEDQCLDVGALVDDPIYARALSEEWARLIATGTCLPVVR